MTKRNIKQRLLSILTLAALVFSLAGTAVPAAAAVADTVIVKISGTALESDTPAFTEGENVLVPVRSLMESQGCKVTWIETVQGALITNDSTVALVYEDKTIYDINSVQKESAVSTRYYLDCLYCGADAAADILGMTYTYDATLKILNLTPAPDSGANKGENGYVDIQIIEDTYVRDGSANKDKNFGSDSNIGVKGLTGDANRLIYLKFDLTGVTPEMVGKANLCMTGNTSLTENNTLLMDYYFYEVDPGSWSEKELTFATQPKLGKQVASSSKPMATSMTFNLTDYIKDAAAKGTGMASLVIGGNPSTGLRCEFYSRENKGQAPYIRIEEDAVNYHTNLPTMEGFGQGQDPWEWAEQLLANSKYEKLERFDTEITHKTSKTHYEINPIEDTFAQANTYRKQNYGDSDVLETKSGPDNLDSTRVAYLKFDLSDLPEGEVAYARLGLWCVTLENSVDHFENVRMVSNEWSEKTLTWDTRPAVISDVIGTTFVSITNKWVYADITKGIADAKARGETVVSLELTDTAVRRTAFSSKESPYSPVLTVCIDDGSQALTVSPLEDPAEYSLTVNRINKDNREETIPEPTRTLETLSGYKMTSEKPQLGQYGGRMDRQVEATGFYYMKEIDGRWWIVDPEGYLMIHMGVAELGPSGGNGARLNELMLEKFGSAENWASQTADYLRNELYLNGSGAFSNLSYLKDAEPSLAISHLVYFLRTYMTQIGIDYNRTGSSYFEGGKRNIFDPDFVTFADSFAEKNIAPYKDLPNIMGWMSDNELESTAQTLDTFLTLDWADPRNAYSYAAAWTFLKDYTGKDNPSLEDVDDIMRQDFLDFMWDRYYFVVSNAVRKHDPNHLYMGWRMTGDGYASRGAVTAAGRYCDIMCCNFYQQWTPDRTILTNWSAWSKNTPFIITEWYAMGQDADPLLKNTSGAGFLVATQQERGLFYQNYALKLLETKNCVGFHWFKYMDNDPLTTLGDSSNVNGNKGIVSSINAFEPYEGLVTEMAELNRQVYRVIDYFDY